MQLTVSAKHKMILAPQSAAIRNLIPTTRSLPGTELDLVPHGLSETFLLRKLGYTVPSPILTHYTWPGSKPPFEVQRKTTALLTMNSRAYVLNGMGTGKTKAALWAWDYLRSNGYVGKLLVVAPLSTLSFVWAREILNTLAHRKYQVLHGSKDKRLERLADPDAEIFVINHDGVKVIAEEIKGHPDIDALVLDELAVYRNGGAARTKQCVKLAGQMKWVWGMTGSPMPNQPTDVWAQCRIVTPGSVPKYFRHMRDELMTQIGDFKWVPKEGAVEKAFSVMQPAVRYALDDILELPEVIERDVDVAMGPKQAKAYEDVRKACYAAIQNKEITAANAGAAMSKLLQISTGWVYTRDGSTVSLDNNARVDALVDAILAADRKLLVFVPFKHALAGISARLSQEGITHAVVSGDTPASERATVFSQFQSSHDPRVLLAHPTCLAHGLTLTAASTVIWFAPVTSLETYEQANARIRRVGQTHKQLVLHLQSTPIERKIYRLLRHKQSVQNELLRLFEEATETGEPS